MKNAIRISLLTVLVFLAAASYAFEFKESKSSGTLTVRDGGADVLVYRFGDKLKAGTDAKYTRSTYIEQLFDLDGKTLLDDFPADHPHHHGIFWAWPAVEVRGQKTQNWHPATPPLRHRFVRWTEQTTNSKSATFTAENHWILDNKEPVATEWVTVTVHQATSSTRAIDVDVKIDPVGGPLTIAGTTEGNKGYGGFCLRAAPDFKGAALLTAHGASDKDIVAQANQWADISTSARGLAVFAAPDYPTSPPNFMARTSYAGFINISWPGMSPAQLLPGNPVKLRNRVLIHGENYPQALLQQAYDAYAKQASR